MIQVVTYDSSSGVITESAITVRVANNINKNLNLWNLVSCAFIIPMWTRIIKNSIKIKLITRNRPCTKMLSFKPHEDMQMNDIDERDEGMYKNGAHVIPCILSDEMIK